MTPSLFPTEPPMTCLGLDIKSPDTIGVPISAFAIVKHIEGGNPCYSLLCTEDVNDVEVLGMLDFARIRWQHLMNLVMDGDVTIQENDED